MKNKKPETCLSCGSHRIAEIFYGLPGWSTELKEKLDRGEIVLGGFDLPERILRWQCMDCRTQFDSTDISG